MTSALRVGHIDLSFHDASALVVESILKKHGHAIERSAAPHEEMFRRMARREADVLVSAWLPASHGKYLEPFRDEVREITVLYEHLERLTGSPVVALNRAVAVAEVRGAAEALVVVDALDLGGYYLCHATRADLLRRLGRSGEAAAAYAAALDLVDNGAERHFLEQRIQSLAVAN